MTLEEYADRRDFSLTQEPLAGEGLLDEPFFVVQLHDARNLHFDLRLSVEGVLVSWAVPKGPSADPSVKRLAVRTEDHPLAYASFEGVIPEGEYGAGTVLVWDYGRLENAKERSLAECLRDGHLLVRLHGARMLGEWSLVRFRDEEDQWLLVKASDVHAGEDLSVRSSVITGRSLSEVADEDS